eukprot:m.352085 g.352085  ORF g.352085 m.352085 type:complete len:70 (-) comp16580_c1_seq15:513-722(-)
MDDQESADNSHPPTRERKKDIFINVKASIRWAKKRLFRVLGRTQPVLLLTQLEALGVVRTLAGHTVIDG